MNNCLLIGGSHDGEIVIVDTRRDHVVMAVHATSSTLGYPLVSAEQFVSHHEIYEREEFCEDGNRYFIYRAGEIPHGCVFETLCNGYRRPKGKSE